MRRTPRHILQTVPVTLTVVSGPLVAMAHHLTQRPDAATGDFSLAQVLRGVLCALLLVPLFLSGRWPLLASRPIRPLLFLAACAVATAPGCPHPYENLVFAVKLIFVMLIFANAFHLAEGRLLGARGLATCAWAVLLMMALSTGIGLATGRVFAGYESRYATGGLLGQPMDASFLLLATLPVFLSLVPRCWSASAGLLLLFASLFFTMCRSSLIAAGAAMGCAFLLNLRTREPQVRRRTTLTFLAILLLWSGLWFGTEAGADLQGRFQDLHPAQGTGSGRYTFWRISLEHIRERPLSVQLLGEGTGSIRKVMEQRFGKPIGSHNDWLDFVNNFGLCGLVGIVWWYTELVRLAWRLRERRDGCFQGACAVTIMLALISIGSGGFFEPCWAISYAALGLWAGASASACLSGRRRRTRNSCLMSCS